MPEFPSLSACLLAMSFRRSHGAHVLGSKSDNIVDNQRQRKADAHHLPVTLSVFSVTCSLSPPFYY
jgi:hypothetical protein